MRELKAIVIYVQWMRNSLIEVPGRELTALIEHQLRFLYLQDLSIFFFSGVIFNLLASPGPLLGIIVVSLNEDNTHRVH